MGWATNPYMNWTGQSSELAPFTLIDLDNSLLAKFKENTVYATSCDTIEAGHVMERDMNLCLEIVHASETCYQACELTTVTE